MRRLLSRQRGNEVSEALLHVFQRFDDMLIEGADLSSLTAAAAEMLQAEVFALDVLNNRFTGASAEGSAAGDASTGHTLLRAASTAHLCTREVALNVVGSASVASASLEHGRGRLGVVWTPKPEPDWTLSDELVLERFAQAASIAIQQDQRRRARRWKSGDPSALELLVGGALDDAATADAIRAAQLSAELKYVVIAMALDPPNVVSDAVATAAVGRALDDQGVPWHSVTVMNTSLIVSTSEGGRESVLGSAVTDAGRSGWRLRIGVGDAFYAGDLNQAALQAREALVMGGSGEAGVITFSSLGVLQLLACIPRQALDQHPDVVAVANLAASKSGASDLALLIAYCETGSLRRTGERTYLHHSSVEYRVRRLESVLGYTLSSPTGRLRALLATTVFRMSQVLDLS